MEQFPAPWGVVFIWSSSPQGLTLPLLRYTPPPASVISGDEVVRESVITGMDGEGLLYRGDGEGEWLSRRLSRFSVIEAFKRHIS